MADSTELTLMAVHAHPDDESIGTGGTLARYSAEGVQTVLVTCTNGEQGDGDGGAKPGEQGHSPEAVAARRLAELHDSVRFLGVTHLELLGYRDSGMDGWSANHDPGVFCNVAVGEAAARLADLIRKYRPQVVVTYDDNGGYGHPDHIQAHRITLEAAALTAIPAKLYYGAVPRSAFRRLRELMVGAGLDADFPELPEDFGTPDELVTTSIDVSAYKTAKLQSLAAHASQIENLFLLRLPEPLQDMVLSREMFTLRSAPAGLHDEDDLFAGLRAGLHSDLR